MSAADVLNVRWYGIQPYIETWKAMQRFTRERTQETYDELWLLEHLPVFTQGQNGKAEHILNAGDIPVIQTDRGGQVTYHGPGQLVAYALVDLQRKKLTIRDLVTTLELCVIDYLHSMHIAAVAKRDAPGVYVNDKKICSIGLRVRKGCSYHGIAFNINMDLSPFSRINPCGYKQLQMTDVVIEGGLDNVFISAQQLTNYFLKRLMYTKANYYCDNPDDKK